MSDLKNIFLSKNNIINNYQNIININKLNNLDYNQKTLLTNNLVETMKNTFDKLVVEFFLISSFFKSNSKLSKFKLLIKLSICSSVISK